MALFIGEQTMISIKRILVPTDFSEHGTKALSYAAVLADQFGAAVELIHILEPVPPGAMLGYTSLQELNASLRKDAEEKLEQLDSIWHDYAFPVKRTVTEGQPFVEIVKHAQDNKCDLIVIGTHGHGAITHMLLGSVAENVVRSAPCPVLTVKHPEHDFIHVTDS